MNASTFRWPSLVFFLVSWLFAGSSFAASPKGNVVYVTDELRLGLYRTEETTGRALKTLISGTRLDILERSLMSIQVRTEDGDEGWVKTAYVVETEPARRRLTRLEAEHDKTTSALAAREADISELEQQIAALEVSLAEAAQGTTDLPAIRAENSALQARLDAADSMVPLSWLMIAAIAALILGMLLGYRWLDRKVRSKFGGVRVY